MIVPFLISLGALFFFKKKITVGEFALQLGAVAIVLAIGLGIAYWGDTVDTEVWNGQVISKTRDEVSCRHSYRCHCHEVCSGSGKNRSCSEECDTCYEHSYDVDWNVHASTKESVSIDTIDRQGLQMPPRWGKAYIGEPWASTHTYTNYIKANPDSVLLGTKGDMQRFGKLVPKYPDDIYDYYYNNPVVNMGVPNVDINVWNWLVRNINKTLGTAKQVHVVVILVPTSDRAYIYALKDAWLGGKKNDVDVVIGSVDGSTIDFAEVMSWSTNKALNVNLKNKIESIHYLQDRDNIVGSIRDTVEADFVRMRMRDMKWIAKTFQPSRTAMIILLILGILADIGAVWYSVVDEWNDDDEYNYGGY